MRGTLALAAVLGGVLSVGLGVMLGGCGAGSRGANNADIAEVRQAAYVTTQGSGFRMAMTLSIVGGGSPLSMSANGAFEEGGRRGAMSATASGRTAQTILDFPYAYLRVGGKLIKGKPWGRFNVEAIPRLRGVGGFSSASEDPSRLIGYLKAAGQVSTVGRQALRGVLTTHYHVLVDLARYPDVVPGRLRASAQRGVARVRQITGQGNLPIDVWIDGRERVRRYQLKLPLCFEGERESETVAIELYDFGKQSIPQPPPRSEVSDLTSEVTSNVSKALKQLHC
jgi:hypothetical protein